MRNVYEVLREKGDAIERVRREVEALRSVTPLRAANAGWTISQPAVRSEARIETVSQLGEVLQTVGALLVDEVGDLDPEVCARLVEATEKDSRLSRARTISRQLRHIAAQLLGVNLM